jgi:hypothetical protein
MSAKDYADDLSATARYALETTRAIAVCLFHSEVSIRESHAFERAKRIVRSHGTKWEPKALMDEIGRQLSEASDGECPHCASR